MTPTSDEKKPLPSSVHEPGWGEKSTDNFGYGSEEERFTKRGLEDWEMVEHMDSSEQGIPYWFIAIFFVLLLVAIGLTFPFWGNRPGYEREWMDWGIPAGAAWVIIMSGLIYYMVDYRHVRQRKKEQAQQGSISA